MYNESFFILIAFICFVAVAFKSVKSSLFRYLDQYSETVAKSIEESELIKHEAEAELHAVKIRANEIASEASELISEAKGEAEAIIDAAKRSIEDLLQNKTQHMMARISRYEEQIHSEVKTELITHVLRNVEAHLSSQVNQKTNAEIVKSSLDAVKKVIH